MLENCVECECVCMWVGAWQHANEVFVVHDIPVVLLLWMILRTKKVARTWFIMPQTVGIFLLPTSPFPKSKDFPTLSLKSRFVFLFTVLMAHLSATAARNNINCNNPDLHVWALCTAHVCAGIQDTGSLGSCAACSLEQFWALPPFWLKCRDTRLRKMLW